jgi:hypothetical protein
VTLVGDPRPSGSIRTTPALARGQVYVITDAGHLHALQR